MIQGDMISPQGNDAPMPDTVDMGYNRPAAYSADRSAAPNYAGTRLPNASLTPSQYNRVQPSQTYSPLQSAPRYPANGQSSQSPSGLIGPIGYDKLD
jgi:hypothetical protein